MNQKTLLLSGKEVSKHIRKSLNIDVDKLKLKGIVPKLSAILVGNDSLKNLC